MEKPVDVWVDDGHGGRDPGVTDGAVTEAHETTELGLTVKFILETKHGLKVGMSRTTNMDLAQDFDVFTAQAKNVDRNRRTNMANRSGALVFVSLHFDIKKPGWRWGAYHDGKASSRRLAAACAFALDPLNGAVGVWVRSHEESRFGGLYIRNFLAGPSVLIEFGPIRDVQRAERLQMATAIAAHIARAVRLEKAKRKQAA